MAKQMSSDLMNMLTDFIVTEIGGGAVDGITYILLLKNDEKDVKKYEKARKVSEEAKRCGYENGELFRIFELSNGWIVDMDLSAVVAISEKLANLVAMENNNATPTGDLIGMAPEKRRMEDLTLMTKYLIREFKEGSKNIEVALFSKNQVPRIVINGVDGNGKEVAQKFNAYAIRHWDLEAINNTLLSKGMRITRIDPCDVIPSRTGVRFIIHMSAA